MLTLNRDHEHDMEKVDELRPQVALWVCSCGHEEVRVVVNLYTGEYVVV